MTLLSDGTLRSRITDHAAWQPWQRIVIDPYDPADLQPCSYDVHLGTKLRIYTGAATDTRRDNGAWWETLLLSSAWSDEPAWVLQPNHFYLATLAEELWIPEDCCGRIEGVSTRARDGVTPHQVAGLLDPGWRGRATLELGVKNPNTILYPGERIAQVTFTLTDHRVEHPYAGRYQGDALPQPARPDPAPTPIA